MSPELLPILIKDRNLALVEVDGQAVVTSANLSKCLEYKKDQAVVKIFNRHKKSFRDYGLYDLSRVSQNGTPLPRHIDTALVRMLTPAAADGRGGGLQDVRVFTKRGALKICMKSNQPKAVAVQEALIDLYERVESGQLVGAARFGRMMETITAEIAALKDEIRFLKSQPPITLNLPDDRALPISIERRRGYSSSFKGGFKFPEVRSQVMALRRNGFTYQEIAQAVKEAWPNNPERHVSKSGVHRFMDRARKGRLKEFGIDVTH